MAVETWISIGTLAVGLLAGLTGWVSALTAKAAEKRASESEARGLYKETTRVAHRLVAETLTVQTLAQHLIGAFDDLAIHQRAYPGSRHRVSTDDVKKKLARIGEPQKEARQWIESDREPSGISRDYMTRVISNFEGYLANVQRIREEFERELSHYREEIRVNRSPRS